MKRIYLGAFLLLAIISFHCQKEVKFNGPDDPTAITLKTTIQGNILDENGQPLGGVTIKAGDQLVVTDNHGYFRARNTLIDRNAALVTAEKDGYFKGYRSFKATSGANQVVIQLIKKDLAGDVDAAGGGSATLANGSKIALPANGVVVANGGAPYTGTVKVYAAYIDPSSQDISRNLPGSFMADDHNNNRVVLSSYGMLAVELQSPAGVKLQIKPGMTATLTTPIPASRQSSAPASISLWYVDEQTGIWKEEGTATRSGNNYVGDVKHFSFWNCDVSSTSVNLGLTLKNIEGSPLVHVLVRLTRTSASYPYSSYGWTDSLGQVSGAVPGNESLLLEVLDPCYNAVYTQTVGPFSQSTNLGVITINNPGSHIVTVKGKLLNCSNAAVTNGYAIISVDNMVRYAATDAGGNFSVAMTTCTSSGGALNIIGVDNATLQQGSPASVAVTAPVTNAGNITACGQSSSTFINYTLDGTNYVINGSVDSVVIYRDSLQVNGSVIAEGLILNGNKHISFGFIATSTGTYTLNRLRVLDLYAVPAYPSVTITAYPQVAGDFYEGSINGQFKDQTSITHTFSCTFRLRREW